VKDKVALVLNCGFSFKPKLKTRVFSTAIYINAFCTFGLKLDCSD